MEKTRNKKRILIFSEYYLPGYKSGGGMRTIVNTVSHLHDKFDFYIVTKDCDGKGDNTPYPNIEYDEWNDVEKAKVFYFRNKQINLKKIVELIKNIQPDILYTNSYFSIFNRYLLLLNRLNRFKNLPYIISPCGELSKETIQIGKLKKNIYINLAKLANSHKNILWKASSEVEKSQMKRILGTDKRIFVAPDMVPKVFSEKVLEVEKPKKIIGEAKMVFLSRINRKKNFNYILENISEIKGKLEIDLIGPVDDEEYWNEGQRLIKKLPSNIIVNVRGSIPHSDVLKALENYHYFLLPTQHENFGHIFLEALSAGCPLIISDRTPWLELEKQKVGWSIPLEDPAKWQEIIQKCIDMDQNKYTLLSDNSRRFVSKWLKENDLAKETLNLFELALSNA